MCRTCKSCGIGVGKGKSYCIECVKQKKSDDKHIWNKTSRKLKNGFNRKEEDTFLQNCILNGIDTTGLIRKEYTKLGKHPRSANWLIKRLKELSIYKEPNMGLIIWERDAENRISRENIAESKGFSVVDNSNRRHSKVKCNKCNNIISYITMNQNGCNRCNIAENQKRIAENKDKRKSVKIEGYKSRVDRLKEFVNNEGEYKKYTTYKETPIHKEYIWYNTKPGIAYRETDLTYKLQWIGYYIYTTGAICPDTPIKDGYKICRKCKEHKDETNFSGNQCKECEKEYRREFILPNEIKKARYRYKTNPIYKLDSLMRAYIYSALKGKYVKTKRTKEILGIEWNEFRDYIEDRFEDWMTWDNHGQGKGRWALQHIVPRDFVTSEKELYVVNYYKNFIPMCAVENGVLKNRILKDQLNEWHSENESIQQIIKRNRDRVVETIPNQI
jgi:hypothetical protein